ncbi:efflux RND transporter permease subunit [Acaryochloris sp. CCMEE 5410]|uniref:efflux RND transporter permease subunit n=1 Tax=Acaryochloris sp. CCMEE 5410 TaxID=310037 RepID=UPI0002483BF6|nr:efflux RND transporter permease subunit [Acaryochloris sp. CCMEE 5410]KAI9134276.1 efflux RND transporter permease subunit [Acaryochloris sp. CCMEE 5410]
MLNLFYRNRQLLILSIALIVVWGLSSFLTLPRLEDPEITPRFATVTTFWPGASAERVESLVSERIETELQEIEEIEEIDSTSSLGVSVVVVELSDAVPDVNPIWAQVRSKVEDTIPDLPPDSLKPEFDQSDLKASALIVALTWDLEGDPNYTILTRVAAGLEDRLRGIPGTDKIEVFGDPQEEILVEINQAELANLGLTPAEVARQLQASDAKVSAGTLRGEADEFLLEVDTQLETLARIKTIPIQLGDAGQVTQLQDIAQVTKGIRTPLDSLTLINGKPGITLSATVESQERVDQWAQLARQQIQDFQANLSDGMSVEVIQEQSQYVRQRLNGVITNLVVSSVLVIGISVVMLGWRAALIVGTALPLVTLAVFGWMQGLGIPLHQMSITGLIIALGLLIDNAIIVVDEVQHRLREGLRGTIAVQETVQHLGIPLLASTLTTVFAFVPIATSKGGTGEFIGTIGLTVILALLSSLAVSLTIIAALTAIIGVGQPATKGPRWLRKGVSSPALSRGFRHLLRLTLAKPILGIGLSLLLPVVGFSQFASLPQQFFPPTNRDQIQIQVEMPTSSTITQTTETVRDLRDRMVAHAEVAEVQWFIGESAPRFFYNINSIRTNVPDFAQGIVQLASTKNLSQTIQSLQVELDAAFPQAQILVKQLEQGPPFGAPIEIEVFGPDMETLRQLGNELRTLLAQEPEVVQTRAVINEALPKLALNVDETQARRVGLSNEAIARQLNAYLDGNTGGSLLESTEDLPVRVRLSDTDRANLSSVTSLELLGSQDGQVPLSAIADINLVPNLATITRRDGQRFNTVEGYLQAGALPDTVLKQFQTRLDQSEFQLPPGYSMTYGGEADARGSAVGNLLATVGLLVILMTATLVLSFNSFLLAGLIALIALLSIGLGAFALWAFQSIFGFTAILGMLGLIGLAINDSIVVLAALREDERACQGSRRAIERVVLSSARHVVATTLTTIVGLVPLMIDETGFWPPLAITIAGGLLGATILALYFVPCIFLLIHRKSRQHQAESVIAISA